jgi:dimethylaniline monooxygenase (N-oxide forming)
MEVLRGGLLVSVEVNSSTVALPDKRTVEIDALIGCTGYTSDLSIISPRFDPSTPTWSAAQGSNTKPLFELYHNVFSPTAPSSLPFLGNVHFAIGGFLMFELASMAVAQDWSGSSQLPPPYQMNSTIAKQYEW